MDRRWRRKGNGWTCPPYDIGLYYLDGNSMWVLWKDGERLAVKEDVEDCFEVARESERNDQVVRSAACGRSEPTPG